MTLAEKEPRERLAAICREGEVLFMERMVSWGQEDDPNMPSLIDAIVERLQAHGVVLASGVGAPGGEPPQPSTTKDGVMPSGTSDARPHRDIRPAVCGVPADPEGRDSVNNARPCPARQALEKIDPKELRRIANALNSKLMAACALTWAGIIDAALAAPGCAAGREPGTIRSCLLAAPSRGDCEHFVGLPNVLNEYTTDEYGRPYGWCEICWRGEQLRSLRAALGGRATEEEG